MRIEKKLVYEKDKKIFEKKINILKKKKKINIMKNTI